MPRPDQSYRPWKVMVNRAPSPILLGVVSERSEDLAKCAALSRFAITEDDYFADIEAGIKQPHGISPGDQFWVQPA